MGYMIRGGDKLHRVIMTRSRKVQTHYNFVDISVGYLFFISYFIFSSRNMNSERKERKPNTVMYKICGLYKCEGVVGPISWWMELLRQCHASLKNELYCIWKLPIVIWEFHLFSSFTLADNFHADWRFIICAIAQLLHYMGPQYASKEIKQSIICLPYNAVTYCAVKGKPYIHPYSL